MYGVVARNQAQLDGFIFSFKNCLVTFQNSLCPIHFHFDYFLILFLDPRISIDQMFFNSGLFPGPSALLKDLCSLFSIKIGFFFFRFFPYKCQRYTYRVLQTIQMKLILLWVWAERAVLGWAKTALKLKYEIWMG